MEIEYKTEISSHVRDNVCRVCLAKNRNNQCIFGTKQNDPNKGETIDLSEKLRLCSGIEVSFIFLSMNVFF